ncbi:MAG: 4Fe-4S dicluster domain-containing protein [Chloroflexi bacterium]|nr:4Fe-4S dicluster domain-containing protein [Chloroflexota bacterium]
MARIAMLIDMSKCMACRGCQVACKEWNELPGETTTNRGSYENPADLSPSTWTRISFNEVSANGQVRWLFLKEQCLHCGTAPCVKVCPTQALKQHELGFVSFERDLCNGCAYCAEFCPFQVPRMEITNALTGAAKASKCTLCQDRVTNGLTPACAKTCPAAAISFGERGGMIAQGEARVAALQARGLANANLYGRDILGGLGAMYVLPETPTTYGLPETPQMPLSASLWQDILQPVGLFAIGAGAVGLFINFLVASRHIKDEEA